MKLTENFALNEFIYSDTANWYGINNIPNQETISNLRLLCKNVMQPVRNYIKSPVIITSGYRCPLLNKKVGGVPTSQHQFGMACDFITPNKDLMISFNYIKDYLEFDQLLFEKNKSGNIWIHVSHKPKANRRIYNSNYRV